MKLLVQFWLLVALGFLATSSLASKAYDSKPLQVTLDDNSRHDSYGWKISSELFHYFLNVSDDSLKNITSLTTLSPEDLAPLNLQAVHGIWLLEKEKGHSLHFNLDEKETQADFHFASSSQLYDVLEIKACLYGNSVLNVSTQSQNVILSDKCHNDKQPHWRNFTVALGGGSASFTVEAVIQDKDDFLIIDKIIVSKKIANHNSTENLVFDEAHLELRDTTTWNCN